MCLTHGGGGITLSRLSDQASVAFLKPIIRHISFLNGVHQFRGNSICLHEKLDCVSAPTHGDAAYGNVLSYLEKLSHLSACEMLEIRLCRYCVSTHKGGRFSFIYHTSLIIF